MNTTDTTPISPLAAPVPGGGWLDHVGVGVAELTSGLELLERSLGVRPHIPDRPVPAGQWSLHAGIHLGGERFLEVFAPNPTYTGPPHPTATHLATLTRPTVVFWFVRVLDLAHAEHALQAQGWPTTRIREVVRAEGPSYVNACITAHIGDPSVPMLIQWTDRRNIDDNLPTGCTLDDVTVSSPEPAALTNLYRVLGMHVPVTHGARPALAVRLATPRGAVEITS